MKKLRLLKKILVETVKLVFVPVIFILIFLYGDLMVVKENEWYAKLLNQSNEPTKHILQMGSGFISHERVNDLAAFTINVWCRKHDEIEQIYLPISGWWFSDIDEINYKTFNEIIND